MKTLKEQLTELDHPPDLNIRKQLAFDVLNELKDGAKGERLQEIGRRIAELAKPSWAGQRRDIINKRIEQFRDNQKLKDYIGE